MNLKLNWVFYTGILYLIAFLKVNRHISEIFVELLSWFDEAKVFRLDILAFSCLTGGRLCVESCIEEIKKSKRWEIPIIVGDSHATFLPR